MKDKNDVIRGACNACDCSEYALIEGTAKCGECGCGAAKHREENYSMYQT